MLSTSGISAIMSRGHNSNCFNLALVAHIHPCTLQNPRLLNFLPTNFLILFPLLTTYLHNPMLHSPITSVTPKSPLVYQTESPESSVRWSASPVERQIFSDYAMPLLITSLMLQGDNLHWAAMGVYQHTWNTFMGSWIMTRPALLSTLTPHVLSPQSSFPLLSCKHLQLPTARFPTLSLFYYLISLPSFYLMTCALVISLLLTDFGGAGDSNHKVASYVPPS